MFAVATGALATVQICGDSQVCTLWGGQYINVGTVTVWNNATHLYVRYDTTDSWYLTEAHLYVGTGTPPTKRLIPGKAPYKSGNISPIQSYTFVISLSQFTIQCDNTTLWLQAHAVVEKIENGYVTQTETAYGSCDGIIKPKKGAWYGNIQYTVQCCEGQEEGIPPSNCTYTQGYWSNKPGVVWPSPYSREASFFESGKTWQQVFDTPSRGNGYYILAHQYMAAVLNAANGADVPDGVKIIIESATEWFNNYNPEDCSIPNSCNDQKNWAAILDQYNNGLYPEGPLHCGE